MGIYDATRRTNLRMILQGYKRDVQFAEKLGYTSAQLSQIKNGHENIGEQVARHIEQTAGKPPGWLDVNRTAEDRAEYTVTKPELSEAEKGLLELYRGMCPAQQETFKSVGVALAQQGITKKTG